MIPAPSKIVESYKIFNIEQKYLPATCPKATNWHGRNPRLLPCQHYPRPIYPYFGRLKATDISFICSSVMPSGS